MLRGYYITVAACIGCHIQSLPSAEADTFTRGINLQVSKNTSRKHARNAAATKQAKREKAAFVRTGGQLKRERLQVLNMETNKN